MLNQLKTALQAKWRFPGGVHPPDHKALSNSAPIKIAPPPQQIILPLQQHIGAAAKPVVDFGDRVLRGQVVAQAEGYISATIHSSIAGHVVAIGEFPVPHPSGLKAQCILIESDGTDQAVPPSETAPADATGLDPSHLRNLIRQAGIVGLGGAAFPSHAKLNPGPKHPIDTLILNGAECEPYITCDDALMRERADDIIAGIGIMLHATGAKRCLIGLENNKPQAANALLTAITAAGRNDTDVVITPSLYPEGGEKQLIQALTGKEVPSNGLPAHIGIICHNVGTSLAVHRAVHFGEPLTSRIVTLTGGGLAQPQNIQARIGTPVAELVALAGGYQGEVERLIMGGPMMGFALANDDVPIVKSTNCILAASAPEVAPTDDDAMPCIRCGACMDACPASLLPQQLYWHAKADEFDQAQEHNLFDCIECGACAYSCPSHIPLVQYYRYAKSEIWEQEKERQKADTARERFEFRQTRIEAEEAEKAAKAAAKKAAIKPKTTDKPADNGTQPDAIQAAIARAKAKQAAAQQTDATTAPQPVAQAAIAAAKAKALAAAGKNTDTTPAANPAAAAIAAAKAKAAAAQKAGGDKASTTDSEQKKTAKPTLSAADIAILKAKKAAQKSANNPATQQTAPQPSAAEIAIAKAKAAAATKTAAPKPEKTKSASQRSFTPEQVAAMEAKLAAVEQAKLQKAQLEKTNTTAPPDQAATLQPSAVQSAAKSAIERAKALAKRVKKPEPK